MSQPAIEETVAAGPRPADLYEHDYDSTMSLQAPGFYPKLGHRECGRMEDYPVAGHRMHHFVKTL